MKTDKNKQLKKHSLDFVGKIREGGGGSGSRTAGAPLEPCQSLRVHRTGQGLSQGRSRAMADRRKRSGFLGSFSWSQHRRRADVAGGLNSLSTAESNN